MLRKNKLILAVVVVAILVGGYFLLAPKSSEVSGVVYRNTKYGFQVSLPDSWKGYTVITGTRDIRNVNTGTVIATAPTIKLRNPLWTAAKPYEDLPIDIYTPAQWAGIVAEQYAVSAAPIPPSELAHNTKYFFALPARYNYDFSLGFEALDQLVHSGAVTAFEVSGTPTPTSTVFTNTAGGYSFKYPSNWNAATAPTPTGSLFGPGATGTSGLGGVDVFSNISSIDSFMNGVAATYSNKRSVTVAGITGVLADVQGTGASSGTTAMIIRNSTLYNIYINNASSADLALFQTLLSSFRFTK